MKEPLVKAPTRNWLNQDFAKEQGDLDTRSNARQKMDEILVMILAIQVSTDISGARPKELAP